MGAYFSLFSVSNLDIQSIKLTFLYLFNFDAANKTSCAFVFYFVFAK